MEEMIQNALVFANTHIDLAPWIIFGLLLLAGLNIPISEDVMNFTTGFLASQNPEHFYQLYFALLMGCYWSDVIAYSLGRFVGPSLFRIKWFSKMVTVDRLDRINHFFNRYGMITLIVGRFIPGIRNPLFMSCGLSRMNMAKFMIADLIAAFLSVTFYFYLYYTFGEAIKETIQRANIVIFAVAVVAALAFFVRKKMQAKKLETP